MKTLKLRRVASAALLSTIALGGLSLLPVFGPLGSQIAGAVANTTTLTAGATPGVAPTGATVTIKALLAGGVMGTHHPTGDISWVVDTAASCGGTTVLSGDATVTGNGLYTLTTTSILPAGSYFVDAFYSSSNPTFNASSGTSCPSTATFIVVNVATTHTTLTAAPNPAPFGAPITFTSVLSGGHTGALHPVGQISMGIYTDNLCNHLAFTNAVNVTTGNGTYTMGPNTPLLPGNYYGSAFFADTDGFNSSSSSGSCDLIFTVLPQPTHLTLTASPNPTVYGHPVTFTSVLSGGLGSPFQPLGQISMGAYTDSNCNTLAFTLAVNVNGNGTYTMGPHVPPQAGTYWGDAFFADTDGFNGSSSSGSCLQILVVKKAHLTVTAPTLTTTFGTIPPLHPTYTGFKNGDTPASLTTQATCTTTATTTSSPGTYPVTCSGAVDPNYTFTYVDGTLTIVAAPTSFTISDFLTTHGKTTTAVLSESGLPPNAVGLVLFETGQGVACVIQLTGLPGEATSCFANFGSNVPFTIKGVFLDEDGNYLSSDSTNTLNPHS